MSLASPLRGLDYAVPSAVTTERPPSHRLSEQPELDLWSTLMFSDVEDAMGFSMPAHSQQHAQQPAPAPFLLGLSAASTLDDIAMLGEEELHESRVRNMQRGPLHPQFNPKRLLLRPQRLLPTRNHAALRQSLPCRPQNCKDILICTLQPPAPPAAPAPAPSAAIRTTPDYDQDDDDDEDDDDRDSLQRDSATPLTAAEDKRRRNTAASASFRQKKKEREMVLEHRAKELEGRLGALERECEALRRENGWLKGPRGGRHWH